jgi:hypothetical protein
MINESIFEVLLNKKIQEVTMLNIIIIAVIMAVLIGICIKSVVKAINEKKSIGEWVKELKAKVAGAFEWKSASSEKSKDLGGYASPRVSNSDNDKPITIKGSDKNLSGEDIRAIFEEPVEPPLYKVSIFLSSQNKWIHRDCKEPVDIGNNEYGDIFVDHDDVPAVVLKLDKNKHVVLENKSDKRIMDENGKELTMRRIVIIERQEFQLCGGVKMIVTPTNSLLSAKPKLIIESIIAGKSKEYTLTKGVLPVGRSAENGILIPDKFRNVGRKQIDFYYSADLAAFVAMHVSEKGITWNYAEKKEMMLNKEIELEVGATFYLGSREICLKVKEIYIPEEMRTKASDEDTTAVMEEAAEQGQITEIEPTNDWLEAPTKKYIRIAPPTKKYNA